MTAVVISYSRSGTTDRLAGDIARRINADRYRLTCSEYRPGPVGFGQALVQSLRGHLPVLDDIPDLHAYDTVVIGSPIWTDTIATPVRRLLAGTAHLPPTVGLFVTSIGRGSQPRALRAFRAALQGPCTATLAVTARALRTGTADRDIAAFCASVSRRGGPG